MPVYNKFYVDVAMKHLGEAMDYANSCCGVSIHEFMDYFITSGIADEFADGSPRVVVGMSGTELAREVLRSTFGYETKHVFPPAQTVLLSCSEEYWTGWILAYYQWSRGYSFKSIVSRIPVDSIRSLYHPLHEVSEERASISIDGRMVERTEVNELQRRRRLLGYTQRLLSEKSGVNLRTLQQYEIGSKDLSKASGSTLHALSTALGCTVEDLICTKTNTKSKSASQAR